MCKNKTMKKYIFLIIIIIFSKNVNTEELGMLNNRRKEYCLMMPVTLKTWVTPSGPELNKLCTFVAKNQKFCPRKSLFSQYSNH